MFAYRYRHGLINTSRRPVRSKTVDHALRNVGQAFATVGAQDPRLTPTGTLDFRLQRMLAAYRRHDPPPLPGQTHPPPNPPTHHVPSRPIPVRRRSGLG